MTQQQALEVKSVLLEIRDSIPATYVDRIFHYYKSYIDPNAGKPCTCQPRYWNEFLMALKDKVETTLNSYEATNNSSESIREEGTSGF
jgi:hypothetical protein